MNISGDKEDDNGLNEPFAEVYDELVSLARKKLSNNPQHSIQTIDLLHETYLRLAKEETVSGENKWQNRKLFFSAASEAMRRILVERARARKRLKRGGDLNRTDLSLSKIASPHDDGIDLEALDSALTTLEEIHPEEAELIKLKFFVGLQWTQIAELTGQSTRSLRRKWSYARAWLRDSLNYDGE